ncbi:MAG: hypothetical protein H6Q67_481 [Firmicutes bacterium]|nr:hypothetical protein [Bacillota bacterium]
MRYYDRGRSNKDIAKELNVTTDNKNLLILLATKEILKSSVCTDEKREEQGAVILAFAKEHTLTDSQLLEFFGTTKTVLMEFTEVDAEVIRQQGLYMTLIASPKLSPVCRLFADAVTAYIYKDDSSKYNVQKIGEDTYRAIGDGDSKVLTADEAAEYSECSLDDLKAMTLLQ